jgi:esterase/lipase superfamily enzyme
MIAHSMGNYLYKQMLKSTISNGTLLLFDNVVLAAADTNNKNHAEWVNKIQCRKQVYLTINENDSALAASRVKGGKEQLARLGHYLHDLNSTQAAYVDFTTASAVDQSHAYVEGSPVKSPNARVTKFFKKVFNGERGEHDLWYHSDRNLYAFERSR